MKKRAASNAHSPCMLNELKRASCKSAELHARGAEAEYAEQNCAGDGDGAGVAVTNRPYVAVAVIVRELFAVIEVIKIRGEASMCTIHHKSIWSLQSSQMSRCCRFHQ